MSRTFTEEEISELKESDSQRAAHREAGSCPSSTFFVRITDQRTGISASEIARVIGICSEKPTLENAILKDLHQISEKHARGSA